MARFVVQLLVVAIGALFTNSHLGVECCEIMGYDSGECKDPADFSTLIPFCKDLIAYRACLPKFQSIWPSHNPTAKDQWIEETFNRMVIERKKLETDENLARRGVDEYNSSGRIKVRFNANPDCENAYKNFFCWLNFPRCDAEQRSLIMCRSVCENYFVSCKQSKDLWRCGNPAYYGGYAPEISESVEELTQSPIYYRAPFPGMPFRDNEFDPETGDALVTCTPALLNTSPHIYSTSTLQMLVCAIGLLVVLAFY